LIRPEDIIIAQTSDPVDYIRLFHATSPINKAYARRHGFSYSDYIGVKRGRQAWLATWNKMYLLNESIEQGEFAWLFYMDADAYFWDPDLSLLDIVHPNSDKAFVFCAGTHREDPPDWNVNIGVFFANLQHERTREVAASWQAAFQRYSDALLEDATPWDGRMMRDQQTLHQILKQYTDAAGRIDFLKVYNGREHNKFNYHGDFVRQVLRAAYPSMEERIRQVSPRTAE